MQQFQSTCPRGARLSARFWGSFIPISIHVPTRGTTISPGMYMLMWYFNPRAHEGHDFIFHYNF